MEKQTVTFGVKTGIRRKAWAGLPTYIPIYGDPGSANIGRPIAYHPLFGGTDHA